MFSLFLTAAKSNDITNIFVKSIIAQKIAIILMGKRELIALLNLSSCCIVMVERSSSRCSAVCDCGISWSYSLTFFYIWYYYVPWTFWNKEQSFASLITVKSRQLPMVSLNFDCTHVWQWTVNSTTVTFGSESVKEWTLWYIQQEIICLQT